MIPQFERAEAKRPDPHLILCGLIIFAIGLFKKTCLADGIQPLVALAFGPSTPTFDQAWIGALAYTFQLYFDFSGYSDMAIGISLMFGIFLPLNFNSPYKATSIIEFWRRWHMTLSQFLRDYLYIPLGGNRRGRVLRYVNLMITMLLGGLWHGAAWTFVVWGALHGVYLCVNHAWNHWGPTSPPRFARPADIAGVDADVPRRRRGLGVLPRRERDLGAARPPRDGRSVNIVFGRDEMLAACFVVDLRRTGVVRAEHAGNHGIRSRQPQGRRGSAGRADAAAFLYGASPVLALGILGIQSTANSSISGSDAGHRHTSDDGFCSRAAPACSGRRCSISSSIPCNCSGPRDFRRHVFRRHAHAECRADP